MQTDGGERAREGAGRRGGEMVQIMNAHMNK
jgi:hypothetical protein